MAPFCLCKPDNGTRRSVSDCGANLFFFYADAAASFLLINQGGISDDGGTGTCTDIIHAVLSGGIQQEVKEKVKKKFEGGKRHHAEHRR